ncbi:MAG: 30S ribosomal protein S20 [Parcubacteria group bacterium]|nr:30S ribosomal protein S20 [Parcubacteria group bacterium]
MPNTTSAQKALRQSLTRRAKNITKKVAMKVAIKKLAQTKDKGEKVGSLSLAYKSIDKAAKSGVIHKNKAARIKSRLAKKAKV